MKLLRTIFFGSLVSVCCIISPLTGFSALPAVVGFTDATQTSGLRFQHRNSATANKSLIEAMAGGVAVFDYDNDGWLDVYLINSGAADFFKPNKPLSNARYRNNGDGTFSDVTEKARVTGGRFGMGAAAADYNGDGWTVIYVTNYGRNQLYRNNGDGSFTEAGEQAGVAVSGWTTHAVWFDYDNDARSVRVELRALRPDRKPLVWRHEGAASAILRAVGVPPDDQLPLSQQRRWHV